MGMVNAVVWQKVHQEYIPRYTPETQLPRRSLVPFPSDDEIISVPQCMYSFSRADSRHKRYLETIGLSQCIGLTVYDSQTKVGCIAHLDIDRRIKPSDENIEPPFLLDVAHKFQHYQSSGPYQIRIVGGWDGFSEETLLPLFETLHHLNPFSIVELKVFHPDFGHDTLNIIFDLDDGMLYNSSISGRTFDKELQRKADNLIHVECTKTYYLHKDTKGL